MISPDLDINHLRTEFARDARVRIDNILLPDVAERLRAAAAEASFELVYVIDDQLKRISRAAFEAMSVEARQELNQKIMQHASQGVGYLYGSCHLGESRPADMSPLMVQLFETLQDETTLALVRDITGDDSVCSVTGHYTRFLPGQFLTRHRDIVENRDRRFAYVLSFTQRWHPDWGGLLQFYEEDGTPRDAWTPTFNSLVLFDVKHIHAVTYVAPYALEPRLSLTGWFKSS